MATSGVTAWSLTARDIIITALDESAIIPSGDEMTAEEADKCLRRLNALLKSWQVGPHLEATGTVTIPADSASGALSADVNEVLSARLLIGGIERWMPRFERDEYLELPNKSQSGSPLVWYVSRQRAAVEMHVWPVPTAITTVKINYLRKPETVTNLTQTVDFPEEHQEALYANLAVRCAGIFGVQPSAELVSRAELLKLQVEDESRPASYYMSAW